MDNHTETTRLPVPAEPEAHEVLPPHYKAGRASDEIFEKPILSGPAHRVAEARDAVALSDMETPSHAAEEALQAWIRQRAYQIWEEDGRPEGQSLAHWLRAEREITGRQ